LIVYVKLPYLLNRRLSLLRAFLLSKAGVESKINLCYGKHGNRSWTDPEEGCSSSALIAAFVEQLKAPLLTDAACL